MSKENIKRVFNNTLKKVSSGKLTNISQEMRDAGYSASSVKAQKVTKTKTWQSLLNKIDDDEVLNMFKEILRDKQDKRARIDAGKELLKLKDRYPDRKHKLTLYDERDEVTG